MAKWMVKAAIQKTLSLLPDGHKLNYLFQKHVTKMHLGDAAMDQALVHCADHVRHMRSYGSGLSNCTTLELGTGWFAVVPIGLFLCGAERVMTIDVTPLLRTENLVIAIRRFIDYDDRGRLSEFLPDVDARRISALRTLASGANGMSVDGMLKRLGIQYLVDDARRLALPDDCIDLIHSNDVFEHIYPDVLEDILREFKRVARPGGVMSHFIDMSDHLSHFDGSIDAYHFLRYSDAQWRFIDNTIAPQSRLRLNEYRAMYARLGIDVAEEKRWPGVLADVRERHLDSRFKTMPPAEVAVTHAYIISKLP